VVWCGVVWCGVVWCGVVWCGVVWCGVVWCGVIEQESHLLHDDGTRRLFREVFTVDNGFGLTTRGDEILCVIDTC
jgi:hypothetical protein